MPKVKAGGGGQGSKFIKAKKTDHKKVKPVKVTTVDHKKE